MFWNRANVFSWSISLFTHDLIPYFHESLAFSTYVLMPYPSSLYFLQALSIHLSFSVPSVVYHSWSTDTHTHRSHSASVGELTRFISSVPGQRVTLALSLCFFSFVIPRSFLSLPPARSTIDPPQCIGSEGHFHLLTLPSIQRERYKWINPENGKALDIETSDE